MNMLSVLLAALFSLAFNDGTVPGVEGQAMLFESGMKEDALRVLGYGDALIEEGVRQNVKQFKRILVPRIEAAAAKGAKLDYTKLMAKIRVLDSIASPPPKGAIPISLEEARLVLNNQFGTTLEAVVEECGQAVLDVNKVSLLSR